MSTTTLFVVERQSMSLLKKTLEGIFLSVIVALIRTQSASRLSNLTLMRFAYQGYFFATVLENQAFMPA
jgi:hypothetical protein